MNGAQALLQTLVDAGVEVCFSNPGTSEMHFVAALDQVEGMRGVLGLFEGVVTGAADGYARMSGKPAVTLLHLGPGLANGLANLHNARRGHSRIINVVGDHADYHVHYDAPLSSDVEALARPMSNWVRRVRSSDHVAKDTADAVAISLAHPGHIATLILPADASWSTANSGPAALPPIAPAMKVGDSAVAAAAQKLRAGNACMLVLGGHVDQHRLETAGRIAAKMGARVVCETFPARLVRGGGIPDLERIPYLPELAALTLQGVEQLVLVGAEAPVTFFAYPETSSAGRSQGSKWIFHWTR